MTDIIDIANDRAQMDEARVESIIRARAAQIPIGTPGECDLCGEWAGRLVGSACAPCRDKYNLP